ncbi:MAG: hypothetical protein JWN70_6585 [Planctomycetaceae bacterium]|nr:hypothetical protein [Planctomycetaceae bacterium]
MPVELGDGFVAGRWQQVKKAARSRADVMSQMCSDPFREFIQTLANQFCLQQTPQTTDELLFRTSQSVALSSILNSISSASTMASIHPDVQDQILKEVTTYCEPGLPTNETELGEVLHRDQALSSSVSAICHADTLRQISELKT